ncbi:uncharacterized protein LOC122643973 [Telopea speciosissima]|uniref:uncharacterized protein LOC122643973 n=1 Tax=Telopea speciosissima TaxID=54955 RepID=UPI001CC70BBF|nr:uncharacterized protein LOC122643973 [Telopea speciosissima]XP_043693494.1 uncharacterized protein LOC122643973 [Telopea speciosissima]
MASLYVPTSFLRPSPFHHSHRLLLQSHHHHNYRGDFISPLSLSTSFPSFRSFCAPQSIDTPAYSNEGTISVINFEDFAEKDWSFLESDDVNSNEQRDHKAKRIISAGDIEENSRVLVSIGAEDFIDHLVDWSPCQLLLVVHDSLFTLAGIKEKYDKIKCWQGELIYVPEKWTPFDVVFLYCLPALPFELDQIFKALAARCSSGARLVISYSQGREAVEKQKQNHSDVIVHDLPDKVTLEKVAVDHSFEITEFIDEPGFYLSVLKFCKTGA